MWLWPDHLTCPDLERWLPVELADIREIRSYVAARQRGWRLPGALRSLAQRWPTWTDEDAQLGAVVVFGPLGPDVPGHVLSTVNPGGRIIDVSTVARPLRWWARPWTWRRQAASMAALRIPQWAAAGLYDLEQYIALAPADAVVTVGSVFPVRPPRPPRPTLV